VPSRHNFARIAALALGSFLATAPAQATTWDIVEVMTGSSGFGASLFHSASGSNPMSGTKLADITAGSDWFGWFNDADGSFSVTLPVSTSGPTFTLNSTGTNDLNFGGGFSTLQSHTTLQVGLNAPGLNGVTSALLGFKSGYVCCGSTNFDPNSFISDGNGGAIMTLWGADGFDVVNGTYSGSGLGMDLRLRLTHAPIPAALPLFGTGLGVLGLFGLRKRRRRLAQAA